MIFFAVFDAWLLTEETNCSFYLSLLISIGVDIFVVHIPNIGLLCYWHAFADILMCIIYNKQSEQKSLDNTSEEMLM